MTAHLHPISYVILLLTLTACTQPVAQPEAPAEPAEPYAVSDKDDPFEIKNLVNLDDPRKIGQTVVVNGKEYQRSDYLNHIAKDAFFGDSNNELFEIAIRTNVYGYSDDPYESGDIRDINFKGHQIKYNTSILNIDFLGKGNFYQCSNWPGSAMSTYVINKTYLTCSGSSGVLWIGFEADQNLSTSYRVPKEINNFIQTSIKNTKIWNECHIEPTTNVLYRYREPTLLIEKCMEEKGIKKTHIHIFYEGEKITTYRFFIMEPYNANASINTKPGWRLVGHLPYSLDFTLN